MKNFAFGLLLALAISTIAIEKHADGSVTSLPAEAEIVDYQMDRLKQDLRKATLIILEFQRRLQELGMGVCI